MAMVTPTSAPLDGRPTRIVMTVHSQRLDRRFRESTLSSMSSLRAALPLLAAFLACIAVPKAQAADGVDALVERQKAYKDALARSRAGTFADGQAINYSITDSLYYPGPGDQFRLRWWGVGSGEEILTVNGRQEIVLPDIGVVGVRGRSLAEIRDTIEHRLRQRSNIRVVDLSVQKLASVSVYVTGNVPNPGMRVLPAGSRLSKALEDAGLVVSEALGAISEGNYFLPLSQAPPSLRKVTVIKVSGDSSFFDLALALNRGDQTQDPLVFNGDLIRIGQARNLVAVSGSGVRARLIEHLPGESYRQILDVVGVGPVTNAECLDASGRPEKAVLDEPVAKSCVGLRSIDSIRAGAPEVVWVLGLVSQPGAVPFRNGMTSEGAVALAGGYLLSKDSLRIHAIRHQWPRLRAIDLAASELASSQYPEVQTALNQYRTHPGGSYSRQDEELSFGDTVVVTRKSRVVWVGGQVSKPGFVPWREGVKIDEIVSLAGGYGRRPWLSRIRVLDPVTGQVVSGDGIIPPGAVVIVPEKRYLYPEQWLQISSSILVLVISLWSVYLQQSRT